ncbi:angiogenin-2-like [Carettochelys insculpta]|uniref:angiogenin-2-like n=1 Tax=Carettochelys insculpta TaxID=44489 RepID=UPI003EBC92F5
MALRAAPLLLLLLAALLVLLGASANQDQYERFLLQHYDPSPSGRDRRYCESRMRIMMNKDKKNFGIHDKIHCKERNTFIHENLNKIKAICTGAGGTSTPGGMRESRERFQITQCRNTGGRPLNNCEYRAFADYRTIVIRCDRAGLPVHFDESRI